MEMLCKYLYLRSYTLFISRSNFSKYNTFIIIIIIIIIIKA